MKWLLEIGLKWLIAKYGDEAPPIKITVNKQVLWVKVTVSEEKPE